MTLFSKFKQTLAGLYLQPDITDKFIFFDQLEGFLSCGINFIDAIEQLSEYQENKIFRKKLKTIAVNMRGGMSLHEAFAGAKVFSDEIIAMLDLGNNSGDMVKICNGISTRLFTKAEIQGKVNNALFPVAITFILGISGFFAYVKYGLPIFLKIFAGNGMKVPVLLSMTQTLVLPVINYWYISLFVIFVLYQLLHKWVSSNRMTVDRWRMKIPLYKKIYMWQCQETFASNLSLMLSNGMVVIKALSLIAHTVDNHVMKAAIKKTAEDISNLGLDLDQAIARNNSENVFDGILIQQIKSGVKTGQVDRTMKSAAKTYKTSIDRRIDRIGTYITLIAAVPVLMLVLLLMYYTYYPSFELIRNATNQATHF